MTSLLHEGVGAHPSAWLASGSECHHVHVAKRPRNCQETTNMLIPQSPVHLSDCFESMVTPMAALLLLWTGGLFS